MERPKIGIALGSGGARGFSHLGVLKILHEANIPIDYIAGSSMGALVGTFYSIGQNFDDLYRLSSLFKRKYFLDFTVPKMGFIAGNRVLEFLHLFTHRKKLEDLPIPVSVVATDLYSGEKVILTKGSAAEAIRASISIPGVFVPPVINNRPLIDGGVVDRVPVSVAREMGADIVIAVDCVHFEANEEVTSIFDVIIQSIDILQNEFINRVDLQADVLLKPQVAQYSARAFKDMPLIIKEGEAVATAHLDEIKQVIADWKEITDETK
ncbi:esterase [Pontibacillus halophilus JSM 076056 = DSM 19796]|uniref:Esterase n=1 Tax=Pontibacillus halophilus JSM 076056 = DSM 19796 TaxID=1385510 RepID=A0A0A5GQ27_9BACI|nr:patatin-like phospholipase family protein [Pontibacillus halophilus]KGX93280.1 esterase [Pontibacillus halophilus JSM 076056 = DSM 19796]